ncbi:FliM/FliN family flagellar motor switch protein [Gemmobacter sp.]|uniref:FliM/FliN family flagellar motor switch protein n=1 Tax=Gemmobacter sp. TaxID=1898957 RepID=UPI002AFF6302|nr:FliM/FliN family flagellar motor switch protein [Gemmobacter sp.]
MDDSPAGDAAHPFDQVPIEITVSVGKARPQVRDLLRLRRDAVLALDRRIEDPVELYIGDRLIARGELHEAEGEASGLLAVRLTEVINLRGGS